ncbi:MAG TPA: hypothetical protein VFL14_01990 [Xanthomonadales bacterium]|nr:hypothetical protein [Xanthomonadales bacterium]
MSGKTVRFVAALAFAAALAACGGKTEGGASVANTSTPQGAIDAAVQSLKAGDLKALVESQVPPSHMDKMRADWKADMAKDPPSDQEKAEFAQQMEMLTSADAEAKLMAQLEPELVKFETEMAPQLPLMIGMGKGLAANGIQENKELTQEQKDQAVKSIDALAKWVQETNFTDRAKVKEAVSKVVASARELNLKTLDEARALSFDDAMVKGSVALRGFKDVLNVYGFSLDKMLDSVKTEVVSQTGDAAKVKVSYMLFEQPLSFETDLVQVDGRWYGKQTIEKLNNPEPADDAAPAAEEGATDDAAATEESAEG